jgi:hypothetical protein
LEDTRCGIVGARRAAWREQPKRSKSDRGRVAKLRMPTATCGSQAEALCHAHSALTVTIMIWTVASPCCAIVASELCPGDQDPSRSRGTHKPPKNQRMIGSRSEEFDSIRHQTACR